MFGLSGFAIISAGLNIPRDSVISALSFLVAVAVSPSQGTFGRMLPSMPSFP